MELNFLYQFTFAVNFVSLLIVLWLGLYVVIHNPRYPISWLTTLTLWSLGGVFLNLLLALNYWPTGTSETIQFSTSGWRWFQGWSVAPVLAFWHHATMLMRPGKLNPWRLIRIVIPYLIVLSAVILQSEEGIWSTAISGNPLFINSRQAGPLYVFFGVALLIFSASSVINLVRSARAASVDILQKQLKLLATVTLIAGLTGPICFAASLLGLSIPIVIISLLLTISVGLMGYGVASYSALVEGRTIHRDFNYDLAMLTLVVLIYGIVCWVLIRIFRTSAVILIIIPMLAIFTHSAINGLYRLMDWFFFRREVRELRKQLIQLTRLAAEGDSLTDHLEYTLNSLCSSIRAAYGLLFVFETEVARALVSYHWRGGALELSADVLQADDVMELGPNQFDPPLHEAALLIPLYSEATQLGVLILGRPINGLRYANVEVERILNPADLIGEILHFSQRKAEGWVKIARMAQEEAHSPSPTNQISNLMVEAVEGALRNLYNYTYLADSPVASMEVVQSRLSNEQATHLDRGKATYEVLVEIIEKLKRGPIIPSDPPPRSWYPYLILKDAYLDGMPNRDIMLKLYISEGTFNRTRRSAVRAVARALDELEGQKSKS